MIRLTIGIKYILTTNVSVTDGLFNGGVGELKLIELNENGNQVIRLWFDSYDFSIGDKTRKETRNLAEFLNICNKWTPIERVTKNITIRNKSNAVVSRKQYPIVPAKP